MSANKKAMVQFNRREYQRLRSLERTAIFSNGWEQKKQSGAIEQQMQLQLLQMQERQQDYQQIIADMSGELSLIEQDTGAVLFDQQQTYLQQLNELESDLMSETQQVLEEERTLFQTHLQQMDDQYREQITQIEEELQQVQLSQQQKIKLAAEYIEKIEQITTWIGESYQCEKFLPDQMREIEDDITLLNRNYDFGNYESVISQSLQIELSLNRMRVTLEELENEWGVLCEAVKQHASRLNRAVREQRRVHPIDMDGNILQDQLISVNHWTGSRLVDFSQRVKETYENISNHNNEYSISDLRNWIENDLPALEDDLVDIVMTARMNVLDSQLRKNIADVIIKTLQEQGFAVRSIDAKRDVIDHPIQVDFENTSGDEIYVYIQPDEDEYANNNISIQTSESHPMYEYELENRRNLIAHQLRENGVDVRVYDQAGAPSDGTASRITSNPTIQERIQYKKNPQKGAARI